MLKFSTLEAATKRAKIEGETESKPLETSRYMQVGSDVVSF